MTPAGSQPLRLVLLFTYRMSLRVWKRQGLVDREIGYYRFMQEAGLADLQLLTYGDGDLELAEDVRPFTVLPMPPNSGLLRYSLMAPFRHTAAFRQADIVKSNQSKGAWTGIVAKLRRRSSRFVVRCGYVRTDQLMRRDEGRRGVGLLFAKAVECLSFWCADAVIVTSEADKRFLERTYRVNGRKVWIIPNSVDDTRFTAPLRNGELSDPLRILAIGRLVKMKNFDAIIEAAAALGRAAHVTIIGEGPHREPLGALAARLRVDVTFIDSVPNNDLPAYFQRADIFVMPQQFGSGMSKVILEAMACGALTVASDIEPHREVVEDGRSGFLTGTSPAALTETLRRVQAMTPAERTAVTARARADIESRYSMRVNAAREMDGYRRLVGLDAVGRPAAVGSKS